MIQVHSSGTTRTNEKIYERLIVEGLDQGDWLDVVIDTSLVAAPAPCSIFELDSTSMNHRSFIAVTPILEVDSSSYCLGRFNENKELCETATWTVDNKPNSWRNRICSLFQNESTEDVSSYDRLCGTHEGCSIELREVIPFPDYVLLRVAASFPFYSDSSLNTLCIDSKLNRITSDFLMMGRSISHPSFPGMPSYVQYVFSVKVPLGQGRLFLYAWDDVRHAPLLTLEITADDLAAKLIDNNNLFLQNAAVDPYHDEWVRVHRSSTYELGIQSKVVLPTACSFRLVVPLRNITESDFNSMIDSVLDQSFHSWTLALLELPNTESIAELAQRACARDRRISFVSVNGSTSRPNYMQGFNPGDDTYVAMIDCGDTLEPNALFEYALSIYNNEYIDVLYCDNDWLLPSGRYANPFFKPSFSIDLLRSFNYLGYFTAIRSDLLDLSICDSCSSISDLSYRLIFHAVEHGMRFVHLPKLLYHRRQHGNDLAHNTLNIPAEETAENAAAIRGHLERLGISATVHQRLDLQRCFVEYDVPHSCPLVSIIIPNKDHVGLLASCIASILEVSTYDNYELIIVENNSTDPETFSYYDQITQQNGDRVRVVIQNEGFNFSKIVNFGASVAKGDYLILLNNDTRVITNNWIELLLGNCTRSDVGVVGSMLYYPDNTIQHAGVVLIETPDHLFKGLPRSSSFDYLGLAHTQRNLSAVTAACMMTPKATFFNLGGFDERFAVAYNDVDYCLRVGRAGQLIVFNPEVELYHYESVSRGFDESPIGRARYLKEYSLLRARWAELFTQGDQFFTPNVRQTPPQANHYHY